MQFFFPENTWLIARGGSDIDLTLFDMETREPDVPSSAPDIPVGEDARKKRRRDILYAFLFLVVVSFLVRIIFDYASKKRLLEENLLKEKELSEAYYQLDNIEKELDSKISQISQLGGKVTVLLEAKEQLLKEKEDIRRRNEVVIQELKERVEGYTSLLLEKDEEVGDLKRANKILLSENLGLKRETNALQFSIQEMNDKQRTLEEKIHQAGSLRADNINMVALRRSGKPSSRSLRASRIDDLRISFDIMPNEMASVGNAVIYLRLVAPNKEVLFDVEEGGGSFSYEKKELFYTLKKDILYKRQRVSTHFDYTKKGDHKLLSGNYVVEIYGGNSLMGREVFYVK